MTINYSERFQQKAAVESYEAREYAAASYSTRIWQLQRPILEKLLIDFRSAQTPVRLLDFACGTGRVLSRVEQFADKADGIDISEQMVAVARTKCTKARLQVGNVLTNPELLGNDYNVITCFRLLLNLEPKMRAQILLELRKAIRQPDGLLLINVHGNSHSLRHPAIAWRRWRERSAKSDTMLNEMSPAETEKLLWENGFRVVRKIGFGLVPPVFYKTPLRGVAFAVDKFFAGADAWSKWSVDIVFVCSPR